MPFLAWMKMKSVPNMAQGEFKKGNNERLFPFLFAPKQPNFNDLQQILHLSAILARILPLY